MPIPAASRRLEASLRKAALAYPEAREDFPWGHRVFKVRSKIFLFLETSEEGLHLSVKLPQTGGIALLLSNVEPTSHNLGKSGWVSASFSPEDEPSLKMLLEWIGESYRAVAPKRLARLFDAPAPTGRQGRDERRKRR